MNQEAVSGELLVGPSMPRSSPDVLGEEGVLNHQKPKSILKSKHPSAFDVAYVGHQIAISLNQVYQRPKKSHLTEAHGAIEFPTASVRGYVNTQMMLWMGSLDLDAALKAKGQWALETFWFFKDHPELKRFQVTEAALRGLVMLLHFQTNRSADRQYQSEDEIKRKHTKVELDWLVSDSTHTHADSEPGTMKETLLSWAAARLKMNEQFAAEQKILLWASGRPDHSLEGYWIERPRDLRPEAHGALVLKDMINPQKMGIIIHDLLVQMLSPSEFATWQAAVLKQSAAGLQASLNAIEARPRPAL